MSLDVVGFGSLCVDFTFKVSKFPRRGSTNLSYASRIGCGGIIGNFLVACSKLGLKCGVLGIVGGDCYGGMVIDCLSKSGVDLSKLAVSGRGSTARVLCIVDEEGERTFIVDPGVQAHVQLPDGADEYVSSCRVFHTDCLSFDLSIRLLKRAKSSGVCTSVDLSALAEHFINPSPPSLQDVLENCDIGFTSMLNAKKLFPGLKPREVIDEMLGRGLRVAVLTLGGRGCMVGDKEGVHVVKPFKVDVVDTTGAGDAFEAGFIYSWLKGLSPRECALIGSAVAAMKCRQLGAQAGLPTLEELKEFLADSGLKPLAEFLTQ